MAKIEHPMQALAAYLPDNCSNEVIHYIVKYKVHLTITRARKSVMGNYRSAFGNSNHKISVNGNLNKYSFLLTLIHELAHLLTFEKYGSRVQSHGKEWKNVYAFLLTAFLKKHIFPDDIVKAIQQSIQNPGASACSEDGLMRVLKKYDEDTHNKILLETLPTGQLFIYNNNTYRKGRKRTKRFECVDMQSRKMYLFSPVCEVEIMK